MPNGFASLALPARGPRLFFLQPGPEFVRAHVDQGVEFAIPVSDGMACLGMAYLMTVSLSFILFMYECINCGMLCP